MARIIHMVTDTPSLSPMIISLPYWVWVLFAVMSISLLVVGMGRSVVQKSKGSASKRTGGGPKGKKKRKRMSAEEVDEMRKKHKEDERQTNQKRWEESIPKRKGVICERQVDQPSLKDNDYIGILENKGLSHFFKPVKGYVRGWVSEYYKNLMIVDEERQRIISKVGTKTITITPDDIAQYLNYVRPRPSSCTYPGSYNRHIDPGMVKNVLFDDYILNQGSGGLKDEYRTMNKVLHHNIFPRGKEKIPGDRGLELLYISVQRDETMDYASGFSSNSLLSGMTP